MAGQGMPQGGNVSAQLKNMLYQRFQAQAQQGQGGWQSLLTPAERVNLVLQVYGFHSSPSKIPSLRNT